MHIAGFKFSAPQTWPERLTDAPMPEAQSPERTNFGTMLHSAVSNVAATVSARPKKRGTPANLRPNKHGQPLSIRRGARGSAGIRADYRDGLITNREVAMMSAADLAARYRVSVVAARDLRDIVLLYGGGSAYRDAQGKPRATPIKRPATTTS